MGFCASGSLALLALTIAVSLALEVRAAAGKTGKGVLSGCSPEGPSLGGPREDWRSIVAGVRFDADPALQPECLDARQRLEGGASEGEVAGVEQRADGELAGGLQVSGESRPAPNLSGRARVRRVSGARGLVSCPVMGPSPDPSSNSQTVPFASDDFSEGTLL
jgi:hypothetical protein